MHKRIELHEGVIRPRLLRELEAYRATSGRMSSYYLDLNPAPRGGVERVKIAVKNALAEDRKRIDELDVHHDVRTTLRHEWERVNELAPRAIGDRNTLGVACFIHSGVPDHAWALRLPWPVRHQAFFENHFVL